MKSEQQYRGFSLTEVLLAVGTLAIGMIFIAGVFPVAIHSTTIATERTIAAVAADEAFAKIRVYGINLDSLLCDQQTAFEDVALSPINPSEFAYPSTDAGIMQKQYYWSALCRRVDPDPTNRLVQVTVFVSRKVGAGTRYWDRNPDDTLTTVVYPVPVWVNVSAISNPDELSIIDNLNDGIDEETFINDGYTIVDDLTGDIYRVVERYAAPSNMIELDRAWQGSPTGSVWVVPSPVGGGRYPCIAIYQRVIRF